MQQKKVAKKPTAPAPPPPSTVQDSKPSKPFVPFHLSLRSHKLKPFDEVVSNPRSLMKNVYVYFVNSVSKNERQEKHQNERMQKAILIYLNKSHS